MHKEILRRVDIHRTGTPPVHITRYRQFIAVLQPIAGYAETSGRGGTGFRCIDQRIIRRSGSTLQTCRITLCTGKGSHRNHSFIKHQRRQVRLKRMGRIVPQPAASPIQGVFHGNIAIYPALNHRERQPRHAADQRIQRLVVKLRVEAADNVYIPFQRITLNHSLIPDFRTERLVRLRTRKRRNRSQQLHCRGRTGKFIRLIIIQNLIGGQVVC